MSELSLRSGPLTLLYQDGFLRYLRHGDREILRMIYFALRDENWGTFQPILENEKLDVQEDHFQIQYDCFHELNGKRLYHWKVSILGNEEGKITFELNGVALEDLLKNRAGLCVLHPIRGVAGQACKTQHVNGESKMTSFPGFVAPVNPFKNLNGLQWKMDGIGWRLQFEGEAFETEDQRNWTDASFKTFCTPLDKPFPERVKKGDQVNQKVTFFPEAPLSYLDTSNEFVEIRSTGERIKLPQIGIGASSETDLLSPAVIQQLRALSVSHYRIEVALCEEHWRSRLQIDCGNAKTLELPLEVALSLSSDYKNEIDQFMLEIDKSAVSIKKILLLSGGLPPTAAVITDAQVFKTKWPGCILGAGTDFNFTELNRNQFDASSLDYVSFSISPQEHAFDNLSLIETLEGQLEVVRSARHLYPDKAIHISPLALKKRFNPYASNREAIKLTNLQKSDHRQKNQFGAVFTVGSIKALSTAQAAEITLFQTVGNQGILSGEGELYPVYHVLKQLLDKPYSILVTNSTNSLKVEALLLEGQETQTLLVANFTNRQQRVLFNNLIVHVRPQEIKSIDSSLWMN